jgi:hypothetical protein
MIIYNILITQDKRNEIFSSFWMGKFGEMFYVGAYIHCELEKNILTV